jgi:hypothetical protein
VRPTLLALGLVRPGPEDLRSAQGGFGSGRARVQPHHTQMLNIVHLGGAAAIYGFFPNKLNGTIS